MGDESAGEWKPCLCGSEKHGYGRTASLILDLVPVCIKTVQKFIDAAKAAKAKKADKIESIIEKECSKFTDNKEKRMVREPLKSCPSSRTRTYSNLSVLLHRWDTRRCYQDAPRSCKAYFALPSSKEGLRETEEEGQSNLPVDLRFVTPKQM